MRPLLLVLLLAPHAAPAQDSRPSGALPDALILGASFQADGRAGVVVGGRGERDPAVIRRTQDGGRTWIVAQIPEVPARLYDVHFPTPTTGFACGLDGVVLRTGDGGARWTLVPTPFPKAWFAGVHFVDERRGFLAGSDDGPLLARTVDGGRTWTRLDVPGAKAPGDLRAIHFLDPKVGLACGSGGLVVRTEDGGATWRRVESGSRAWLRRFWFTDARNGFLAAGDGKVLATADGGATWTARGGVAGKINGMAFVDGARGLVATMDGDLWRTSDGGAHFERVRENPGHLTAVVPLPDATCLVFGDHGVVLRESLAAPESRAR